MVYNWLYSIQQVVYPCTCLLCGASADTGLDLCAGCRDDLPYLHNACPRCGLPLPEQADNGSPCGQCQRTPPPFDRCLTPFAYLSPVADLVNGLKFHKRLQCGRVLSELLLEFLEQKLHERPQLLIPVPLHPARQRERGYNQALELARPLGRRFRIPVDTGHCRRTHPTLPQSALTLKARKKNIRGAFTLKGTLRASHVALIDDVVTTGNTVAELARLLKRNGVERVEIWAPARTPGPSPS